MSYTVPKVKIQSYYYQLMNEVSTKHEYSPFKDELMQILIRMTDDATFEDAKQKYILFKHKLIKFKILEKLDNAFMIGNK
jgi:hypothetical protein